MNAAAYVPQYRVRVVVDDDMDWSWLDQAEWADESPEDFEAFGVLTEKTCNMGEFHVLDSLWGVTFLADKTHVSPGTYDMNDVAGWELGDDEDWQYVASIVRDGQFGSQS